MSDLKNVTFFLTPCILNKRTSRTIMGLNLFKMFYLGSYTCVVVLNVKRTVESKPNIVHLKKKFLY